MKYKNIIANSNIQYIAYVDASGDDGFNFKEAKGEGSSICYTVALFISAIKDIQHNISVLNHAKMLYGHQDLKNELKYSKLRRHYNSDEIHNYIMDNLQGTLIVYNTFKKHHLSIADKKSLSCLCHCIALDGLSNIYQNQSDKILIIVDRMKKVEEDAVSSLAYDYNPNKYTDYPIIYMDSKDFNAPLIQIADFFAGMCRSVFEKMYHNKEEFNNNYVKTCKLCIESKLFKKSSKNCLFKRRKVNIPNTQYIKKSLRLLYKDSKQNIIVTFGLGARPANLSTCLSFVDCILNKTYQR